MNYGLEERYITWSTVPGTRSFHWYKPCSKTSFQMYFVLHDDVMISHRKQPTKKATVIMDDCQPGIYITCVYDKEWFLGMILVTLEEDQDVQVKFMMNFTQNHFSWPRRDDVCWVSVNYAPSAQSSGACGYCLSEKEFNNILKLFENFSV